MNDKIWVRLHVCSLCNAFNFLLCKTDLAYSNNYLYLTKLPKSKVLVISWLSFNLIHYTGSTGVFFASFHNSIFSI